MGLPFPGGSEDKASACNAGDPDLIPGWRRSPGVPKAVLSDQGEGMGAAVPLGDGPIQLGHLEMLLAVREGGRWAVQACPLHGCSCVWKPSSEPSPDV